jgi:hypothetical protein
MALLDFVLGRPLASSEDKAERVGPLAGRLVAPTLDYIWKLERENPDSSIAVLIPQLIESHWYYSFLHNQKAAIFRSILLLKARDRMVVVNVPWNLERQRRIRGPHRLEPWNRYPAWIDN